VYQIKLMNTGLGEVYYYRNPDGAEHGPYQLQELIWRAQRGDIGPLTRVREEGFNVWMYASDIQELRPWLSGASPQPVPLQPMQSKPLSQLSLAELGHVLDQLAGRYLRWLFVVWYTPVSLWLAYVTFALLEMHSTVNALVPPGPADLQFPIVWPLVLLCWWLVAPWSVLLLHWNGKLSWKRFLLAEGVVWLSGTIGALVWCAWTQHSLMDLLIGLPQRLPAGLPWPP